MDWQHAAPKQYRPRVGEQVRIKATVITRKYGVRVTVPSWGNRADCVAWPGEVGIVVAYEGGPADGRWTGYRIEFPRGRNLHLATGDDGSPECYSVSEAEGLIRHRGVV